MIVDRPNWTFSGDLGPDHWAEIDPAYAKCAAGTRQSPVDLESAVPGQRVDLALSYHLNRLTYTDLHWTLQIRAQPGGLMSDGNSRYELSELHFHTPAEHAISGAYADLEAHFVHQAADRSLAVVAVLLDAHAGDHPIDELLTAMPEEQGGTRSSDRLYDLQRLIPLSSKRYRYTGSRTAPPCDEDVSWVVMERRGSVGSAALAAFAARYGPNSRPLQPLNGRHITLG